MDWQFFCLLLVCCIYMFFNQFIIYSQLTSACQMQAIGVASTYTLADASFSASTERTNFEAFRGRLNAYKGWSPGTNDRSDDYLQVDLWYEFLICAVATQLLMIEQQSTSYSYPWMVPLLWSTRKTMSIRLVKIATAEIIYRAAQDILKVYYREILKATSMRGLNLSHIVQIYHGYQEYSGSTVLTY